MRVTTSRTAMMKLTIVFRWIASISRVYAKIILSLPPFIGFEACRRSNDFVGPLYAHVGVQIPVLHLGLSFKCFRLGCIHHNCACHYFGSSIRIILPYVSSRQVVQLLLSHRADPSILNKDKVSPYQLAKAGGHTK